MTTHKESIKTQTDHEKRMTDKEKQRFFDKMSSGWFEVLKPKEKIRLQHHGSLWLWLYKSKL